MFHLCTEICIKFIWEMVHNFQSNYNYTKIRLICSGVILAHIVLISCNFVGQFVSTFRISIPEAKFLSSFFACLASFDTNTYGYYRCITRGNPKPAIEWTINGRKIRTLFNSFNVSSSTHGDRYLSNLRVLSKRSWRKAELKCTARNNLGADSSTLTMKVEGMYIVSLRTRIHACVT